MFHAGRFAQSGAARFGALAAGVLSLLATIPAGAETQQATPEGIVAGRWFLAPYASMGASYDSNIFRASDNSKIENPL